MNIHSFKQLIIIYLALGFPFQSPQKLLPRTRPRTTRGLCRGLPADYPRTMPRTMPQTTRRHRLCRRLCRPLCRGAAQAQGQTKLSKHACCNYCGPWPFTPSFSDEERIGANLTPPRSLSDRRCSNAKGAQYVSLSLPADRNN